jgi:hypothetical protein
MHTKPQPQSLTSYQRLTSDKKGDSFFRPDTFLDCLDEPEERHKVLTIIRVIVDYALAYPIWIALIFIIDTIRAITECYNSITAHLRTTSVRSVIKDHHPTQTFRGLSDLNTEVADLLATPKNKKLVQLVLTTFGFPVLLWALHSGLTMTILCSLAICSVVVLVKAYELEIEGLEAKVNNLKKSKNKVLQAREEGWDVVNDEGK